jgi:FecR protein
MHTNGLFRYIGFITLMLASISVTSQAFALENRAWNVESHAGTVWVKQASLQPVALNPNESLRGGSTIETGEDGRVVLIRGDESIIVSPRTSLALPEHNDTGMATTILQSFGTILLQVEKRAKQHFEVETPFLAAVVKGTKFTVTVDQSGAAVHVVEGAVEVIDLDTGDIGMVRPGQTAHTPAAQGVGLSVGGPGAAAPARAAAPVRTNKVVPAPRQTEAAAPVKAPAPIIMASVGSAALDVSTTTNGLARAATVSNGQVSDSSSNVDKSAGTAITPATNVDVVGTAGSSGNVPAGLVGNTNAVAVGLSGNSAPGLVGNLNSNQGGNSAPAASNGLAVGVTGATPPGLTNNPSSNAGGIGLAVGLTGATPPGLTNNPNSNAGGNGNGNGLAVGQTGATPPGLANNPNSNAGGNGNGNGNANSNAGGNGNGNGNANSNAGGNGNGNGKA